MLEGHRQRKELPDSSSSSSSSFSHSARQSAQREEQNKTAGKGQKPISYIVSDSWSSSMMLVILKSYVSQQSKLESRGREWRWRERPKRPKSPKFVAASELVVLIVWHTVAVDILCWGRKNTLAFSCLFFICYFLDAKLQFIIFFYISFLPLLISNYYKQ